MSTRREFHFRRSTACVIVTHRGSRVVLEIPDQTFTPEDLQFLGAWLIAMSLAFPHPAEPPEDAIKLPEDIDGN